MLLSALLLHKKLIVFWVNEFLFKFDTYLLRISSMYFKKIGYAFLLSVSILFTNATLAQQKNNWTNDQLMDPAMLAKKITEGKNVPLMISVGPMALIPHSIDMGPASEEKGLVTLKDSLSKLSKDKDIVIYCGCCPFERCPNVRPAIDLLKQMKFSKYHLLNLPVSIKANWIDKGYPTID